MRREGQEGAKSDWERQEAVGMGRNGWEWGGVQK